MSQINKKITKNLSEIILVFLFLGPIVDILTGYSIHYLSNSVAVGITVRTIFMLFMIYYIIFLNNNKYRKISIVWLSLIVAYILIFLGLNYINDGLFDAINELKWISRIFYFPIIFIALFNMIVNKAIKIKGIHFIIVLVMYILTILICNVTGINLLTYNDSKLGFLGIFYSANEVGAILSLGIPFLVVTLFNKTTKYKKYYLYLPLILITAYVMLGIGTKVPIIALAFSIAVLFIIYLINICKEKHYKKFVSILSIAIVLITSIILLIPNTPFYKNIMIHAKFLKINNFSEIFTNYNNVDRLIFSDRLTFAEDTKNIYENSSLEYQIIGIGYSDNKEYKTIEIDYLDLFYRYGIFGLLLILFPFIFVLWISFKKYFANFKKYYKNLNIAKYVISIILIITLALFSGHVFTAPSVSLYLSLITVAFYKKVALKGGKNHAK